MNLRLGEFSNLNVSFFLQETHKYCQAELFTDFGRGCFGNLLIAKRQDYSVPYK
jgi:hypothetical protein